MMAQPVMLVLTLALKAIVKSESYSHRRASMSLFGARRILTFPTHPSACVHLAGFPDCVSMYPCAGEEIFLEATGSA